MTDNSDPSIWYRADQDAARSAYAAADSATLAALLPALDREIETGKQALAMWQRSFAEGQDADAALEEQRNDVVRALRSRAQEDPAWQQMADEVGATLQSALEDVRTRSQETGHSLIDVAFVQAVALTQRRHLVRQELQQRGLLPVFPR